MYDQNVRRATMLEPTFVLVHLRPILGLALTWRRWFETRSVPLPSGPDREADLIAVADEVGEEGKAWLLIFEFQSEHDDDKPEVLQLEAMIFLCHAKDPDRDGARLLPLPVLVYLKGTCPRGEVSVLTPTRLGFTGKPAVWEVANDSASTVLAKFESGECPWGAMFWTSLMAGADREDVIRLWLKLRDELVPEKHRADVTYVVLELAELIGRRLAWNRVLQGVNMEMSQIAREVFEMGEMRANREALIAAIQLRFPEVLTPDAERAIADLSSLPLMRAWLKAAMNPKTTADDFLAVLRG